ncbi:MAG: filamentous hemagglutinin N-terminal domain-containing protein [Parvibaculum sp.]|uniref:filamentous hemagglutinin N-terminal domain-containing protein n=1 Tax=Parvibaculum sp. TaxID=2024848 RepID=UPI003C71E27A
MNQRKYRLLTSTALTRHVAAFGAIGFALSANSAFALDPNALPQDPNVVGGAATFNLSGPATLNVNQSTDRTVIDWRSFDIGSNATTNFIQPNSSSIAVNRVNNSSNPTEIQGNLNANGQVWILNANGVLFGKTAKIDVAGIVASTANISVQSFMSGDTRLQLTGADGGSVTNEGNITVADGGLAAFVAPAVRNSGTITARVGQVALAAGTTFTLDLAGDRLVEIGLGADNAIVDHSGHIVADGSTVQISARAAGALVDSVVNVSGTVLASSAHEEGGTIILTADNITTTADAVLKADAGTNGDGGTIYGYADKLGKYDGTFSAQGGSQSGDGGFIETSGETVNFGSALSVSASAANGAAGKWLIDPNDITIDSALAGALTASLTGGTSTEVSTAGGTGGNGDITLDTTINAAATNGAELTLTGRRVSRTGSNTVNISGDGALIINVNAVNNTPVGGTWIQDALNVIGNVTGATVNVGAGTYAANNTISKANVTLAGADGAKIAVGVGQTGVTINASDVTLSGFEIAGPVSGNQATLDWTTAGNSWGVFVTGKSNSNVTITDNNIHDVRTGILIANSGANGTQDTTLEDAASGTIANNVLENTKGGILIQYRDGHTFDIHGNSEGVNGNEWGIVTGLQNTKIASDPSLARQQQILNWATDNGGMTVLDRQYSTANRSSVTVDATGVATAADDFGLGNGVGNERQPINNIQAGVDAVVTGGTVNIKDGTYVVNSANGYRHGRLEITKSLNLVGQSEAGTIIDGRGAATYGLRVVSGANNVSLSNFTVWGATVGQSGKTNGSGNLGYGIKVEDVSDFSISHVTTQGAFKSELDLNGVINATIDHVTANGAPVGGGANTGGNGISIADSQNITVTNTTTLNNNWGGIAIYQSNRSGGYSYQTKDITIAASNIYGEANPVYMEDESTTNNFGAVTVEGFDYIARNTNPTDAYTWFQKTQQGAIDVAVLASGYVQGWLGSAASNIFTVGYNTAGTQALSINTAINAASTGATVNVLSGVYDQAVTINKGLTLQGADANNRAQVTGGILLSGTFSDLALRNLSVTGNAGSNTVIRGGSITNLIVDNVKIDGQNATGRNGFIGGQYSGDISITNSQFENISGGSAFDTRSGAGTSRDGTQITSAIFSGNLIDNVKGGITFRQQEDGTYSDVTISNNIVKNIGSTTNTIGGIFKIFNADTVNFASNAISDIGTNGSVSSDGVHYGAALLTRGVNELNVADNIFTNVHMAVATEKASGAGVRFAAPGQTNFTGNTFDNTGYAFFMPGDAADGGNVTFGAGNQINSGADTIQYIVWRNSNALDLTNVKFNGELGSEMSDAELFATEDLITHGTDLASSGLATVKAGNVYVTTNSGSVQRGIDKVATGGTVNVNSGTYGAFGTSFGGASDVTIQAADGAIIDATGLTGRIIDLRADGTTLTGFTINGDGGGVGVSISGQGVTVSDNTINGTLTGVQTTTQYSAGNAIISGNTINTAYGISLQNTGNTVSGNTVTASMEGVGLAQGANTFTGNTFDIVYAGGHALQYYGTASPNDLSASDNTVSISGGSLQGAVDLAGTDGDLNLAAGSYGLISTLYVKNNGLTLTGAGEGQSNISTISAGYGIYVTGDDVKLSDFTFNGNTAAGHYAIKVQPDTGVASDRLLNFTIDSVTINGSKKTGLDLNGVVGATINNLTVTNTAAGNGIALTDSANVTITNAVTSGNAWGGLALYQTNRAYDQQVNNITVDGTNSFGEANPVYMEDESDGTTAYGGAIGIDFGTVNIAGYTLAGHNVDPSDKYTWLNNSVTGLADWMQVKGALLTGYVTGWTGSISDSTYYVGHTTGGDAMSINAAVANSATGNTINVASGSYGEDVVVTGARNIAFDGSTVDSFTQNVASAIGGTVSAVNGFVLNATTLLSNTVLNGSVTATSIDGSTAGGQTLTVNGGNNALGSLGATTRLGATSISGATTLNGSTYAANALSFAGPVTLTQALTTFNTTISPSAAGNITFTGSIFGTTDGAQNVAFIAGAGTGAAGANGDISLQNAGTDTLWLGSVSATGDDFSGATVYVGGDYNSTLTGNQAFTSNTLHTRGSVTSTVGGDATGPIVSGGNVDVTAGGNFNGNVTAPTGTVSGNTVTGTFTGNTFNILAVNGVDVDVFATTLNLTSPSGTVDGTFTNINTGGSGSLVVNGKTRTGNLGTNPNQIVVEGYTLPAGSIVTPSGEIILPNGMMIGLVSPQAGPGATGSKPKIVVVHSVQRLGELLAQGYVAIIIDLSKDEDDQEEIIALAN